jgi:biopolymer transport protein ExbB/TolQ
MAAPSMSKQLPVEFVFQLFSLLIAILLVHGIYVSLIRPNADAILQEQALRMQEDQTYVPERSVFVLVRDYEQEACFVLMLWALAIMSYKGVAAGRERRLLQMDLVPVSGGTKILPQDTREFSRTIEALPHAVQRYLLPRALLTALQRFNSTGSIQDVSTAVHTACESESDRLESELSMVRYIAWAIPSIGFIGTVRGIGEALAQAHRAVEGDITGVTQSLGVAFNSTFIALVLSIFIMFALHQLQLNQERLVFDSESYVDQRLISHLRVH